MEYLVSISSPARLLFLVSYGPTLLRNLERPREAKVLLNLAASLSALALILVVPNKVKWDEG